MNTVRTLINTIAAYIDMDTTHYIASSIVLPLEGNGEYHFGVLVENDLRSEIYIGLGDTLSKFKHGHIHTVYCTLPREFVTPEMEKYRDHRDPAMYKFWLPERIFNSLLQDHPVDVKKMTELAYLHYIEFGRDWDDPKTYLSTIQTFEGWEKYFYPGTVEKLMSEVS